MATEGSEFIVKLNGIKLPREAEDRIAAELQATLLRQIAVLDLKVDSFSSRLPDKTWRGIWIERFKGPGPIPTLEVNEVR